MLLLLMACMQPTDRSGELPRFASAALVMEDGSSLSVAIELSRPHERPRVRYARGLYLFDGSHLAEERDGVFVDPLDDTHLRPRATSAHLPGPGRGFTLRVEGGTLLLDLPHTEVPLALLEGIDHAEALYLLTPAQIDPVALERVGSHFKAIGSFRPQQARSHVDGDLSEWRHQPALALDEAAWVLEGDSWWSGPRDASMAVATRLDRGTVRLAIRVHDNDLQAADEVEVELGWTDEPMLFSLLVGECAPPSCARVEIEHGTAFELSFSTGHTAPGDPLPVRVSFHDRDGSDPETVLSNTPDVAMLRLARNVNLSQPPS